MADTPRALRSQALTKRKQETALMPPPPAPKRIKRPTKVVEEDTYTDALSHIIARDFFPGLLETQVQEEYLAALESRDREWIAEAGRKLTSVMTPGTEGRKTRGRRGTSVVPGVGAGDETPRGWGGDTPAMSVAGSDVASAIGGKKKEEVDTNMSLSAFQATYTSEDSESFNTLIDNANAKRREKHAWFWNGNKLPSAQQVLQDKIREKRLLESGGAGSSISTDLILAERARDKRPASVNLKKTNPKNAFMFGPESIEDTLQTQAQVSEAKSLAPPKTILHSNTKFPAEEPISDFGQVPQSPAMSAVDAAIAGRPRPAESEPEYTGSETPRVGGYAFVDTEPTPSEIAYCKGEIEVDPDALLAKLTAGASDAAPNPFHLKESSRREALHHRMVEKISTSGKRADADRLGKLRSGETPGRTQTPKFLSATPRFLSGGATPGGNLKKKEGDLTPAAQSLFRKIGTPIRVGSAWDEKGERRKKGLRGIATPVKR